VILDLEDSVAPDAKLAARDLVCAAVKAGGFGRREVVVRINGLNTASGADDMAAVVAARPDAILVPKVSTVEDVHAAAARAGGVALWAMIETPLAIMNIRDIAAAAPAAGLTCFIIGTNDLVKDSRMTVGDNRLALVPALSLTVLAARAFGLACIDGVFNDLKDEAGYARECAQGVVLGMDGKTLIHPGQIDTANRVFAPSEGDVAWARDVISLFNQPEQAGAGVVVLNGKMVERLHLAMAQRIMAVVEAMQ
jgi:citrate lyase subunit beta / citryl-CoA lyase